MRPIPRSIALLLVAPAFVAMPIAAQTAATADAQAAQTTAPAADTDPTIAPLRRIGGGVLPPRLLTHADPQFSEQARKAKMGGDVLVSLIVDTHGMPRNVHVVRGVGMGLDENAVAAVEQYTFQPAMEAGKPVPVQLNVEVNFQIFGKPNGNGVPKVLHAEPIQISDEARQNHAHGFVLLGFVVDPDGNAQNVRVLHGFGMGMDERAVAAIQRYKFAPFTKDGHTIAEPTTLQMTFDAR